MVEQRSPKPLADVRVIHPLPFVALPNGSASGLEGMQFTTELGTPLFPEISGPLQVI